MSSSPNPAIGSAGHPSSVCLMCSTRGNVTTTASSVVSPYPTHVRMYRTYERTYFLQHCTTSRSLSLSLPPLAAAPIRTSDLISRYNPLMVRMYVRTYVHINVLQQIYILFQ